MRQLALLVAVAAAVFFTLRYKYGQPAPKPAAAPTGEEEVVAATLDKAKRTRSFDPVCAALRQDLAKVDQPLGAPHVDLRTAPGARGRIRAAGENIRPEHATLVQVCDLLIHANEERDAQRARQQAQIARPQTTNPLDVRPRGTPAPDIRGDATARAERQWEDYRQKTVATAKQLLGGLEGKTLD